MHPAGLAAYEARDPERQNRYSFENRNAALSAKDEKTFRANKKAWENFSAFPPSYRHPAIWWVVSAKKPETRERRLATLIEDSAAGPKDQAADRRRRGKHERRKAVRFRVRLFGAGDRRADAAEACGDSWDDARCGEARRDRGDGSRSAPLRWRRARGHYPDERRPALRPTSFLSRSHPTRTAIRCCGIFVRSSPRQNRSRSSISPPSASMATMAARGWTRRANAARCRSARRSASLPNKAGGRSQTKRACLSRSSGLRESTGRGAGRSRKSGAARRGGSSSPARSSTASMSTTSPQIVEAAFERRADGIFNGTDDEPAPPQDVLTYAAELLRMPPPPRSRVRGRRAHADGAKLLRREQARPERQDQTRARRAPRLSDLPRGAEGNPQRRGVRSDP